MYTPEFLRRGVSIFSLGHPIHRHLAEIKGSVFLSFIFDFFSFNPIKARRNSAMLPPLSLFAKYTICIYVLIIAEVYSTVTYYIKWVTTSWT